MQKRERKDKKNPCVSDLNLSLTQKRKRKDKKNKGERNKEKKKQKKRETKEVISVLYTRTYFYCEIHQM